MMRLGCSAESRFLQCLLGWRPGVWWWRRRGTSGGQAVEQTTFDMCRPSSVKWPVSAFGRRGIITDVEYSLRSSAVNLRFANGIIIWFTVAVSFAAAVARTH